MSKEPQRVKRFLGDVIDTSAFNALSDTAQGMLFGLIQTAQRSEDGSATLPCVASLKQVMRAGVGTRRHAMAELLRGGYVQAVRLRKSSDKIGLRIKVKPQDAA